LMWLLSWHGPVIPLGKYVNVAGFYLFTTVAVLMG
jgi:hypothetical protein